MICSISGYKTQLLEKQNEVDRQLKELDEIESQTSPLTDTISELKAKFPQWSMAFLYEVLDIIASGEDKNFFTELMETVSAFCNERANSNSNSNSNNTSKKCPFHKGDILKDEETGGAFTVDRIKGAGRGYRLIDTDGNRHKASKVRLMTVKELEELERLEANSSNSKNEYRGGEGTADKSKNQYRSGEGTADKQTDTSDSDTSESDNTETQKGEWIEVSGLHDEEHPEDDWQEYQSAKEEETGHSVHIRQAKGGCNAVFLKSEEGKYAQSWLLEIEEPTNNRHHLYLLASTFMGEMLEGVIPDLVIYEERSEEAEAPAATTQPEEAEAPAAATQPEEAEAPAAATQPEEAEAPAAATQLPFKVGDSEPGFIEVCIPPEIDEIIESHQLAKFDKMSGSEQQGFFELAICHKKDNTPAGFIFFYLPNYLDLPCWEGTWAAEDKEKSYSGEIELGRLNEEWLIGVNTKNDFPVSFIQDLTNLIDGKTYGVDEPQEPQEEESSEQSEAVSDNDSEQTDPVSDNDSEQTEAVSDNDSEQSDPVSDNDSEQTEAVSDNESESESIENEMEEKKVQYIVERLNSDTCKNWRPDYFKFVPANLVPMVPEGTKLAVEVYSVIEQSIVGRIGIDFITNVCCLDSGLMEKLSLVTAGSNSLVNSLQQWGYFLSNGKMLRDITPEPPQLPDGINPGEGIKNGYKTLQHDSLLDGSIPNSAWSKKEWVQFCELVGIAVEPNDKIRDLKRKLSNIYREACITYSEERDKVAA